MDDQQRARELLAAEYERDGITHVPDCIRREAMLTKMEDRAIRAITAALRVAPEGWRLRKDGAGIAVTAPNGIPGGMTIKATGKSLQERLLYALCDSFLAGRPQRNEVMALDWEDAPSWAVFASTGPNGSLWHEAQPELIFDDPPYYGRKGGRWERISYAPRTARLFQRPDSPQEAK